MKKIILILGLSLMSDLVFGQNFLTKLANRVTTVNIHFGQNKSSLKNPEKYGIDTITDHWKRLITPRVSNRWGVGLTFQIIKNLNLYTGIHRDSRGWIRDSLPIWDFENLNTIPGGEILHIRGELIHNFISIPLSIEYEFGKKIKFCPSIGVVLGKRIPLRGSQYSEEMKKYSVVAPELASKPYVTFNPLGGGTMYVPKLAGTIRDYAFNIGGTLKIPITSKIGFMASAHYQSTIKPTDLIHTYIRHELVSGTLGITYSFKKQLDTEK